MPRKAKLDDYQQTARELAAVTGQPLPTGVVAEVRARHAAKKAAKKSAKRIR